MIAVGERAVSSLLGRGMGRGLGGAGQGLWQQAQGESSESPRGRQGTRCHSWSPFLMTDPGLAPEAHS